MPGQDGGLDAGCDETRRRCGAGGCRAQSRTRELAALDALMPGRLEMVEIRAALPGALIVGDSTQAIYAANPIMTTTAPGLVQRATGFGALGYGQGARRTALAAPRPRWFA